VGLAMLGSRRVFISRKIIDLDLWLREQSCDVQGLAWRTDALAVLVTKLSTLACLDPCHLSVVTSCVQ
jgi:hypothetical protein